MHYYALVLTREGAEEEVTKLMSPHKKREDTSGGFWDWWVIGGRWTGCLTDYDPADDPTNVEWCHLCGGTGTRVDMTIPNGCNGCNGTGTRIKWPTSWRRYDGDIQPVSKVLASGAPLPFTVVTNGGVWHKSVWDGEEWRRTDDWPTLARQILERHADALAVVVDYHG